ncbi:MAG: aldehyde dehydrogenase (NADP(+)) [Balneola sp.]
MITGKNIIGNSYSNNGDKTYRTFNPVKNEENPASFFEANESEINTAVQLATEAFKDYRNTSGKDKAAFLRTIAEEILNLGEELIDMYCMESGLPKGRAEGERGRTVNQLRAFADLLEEGSWVEATIDNAIPDREPLPKSDIRKMNIPLGPVAVFGSSNFPFAFSTAGGDTASALAAGCPVIVKAHPMHSGTSEMVGKAIITAANKTNMPEGVFSNLNSSGIEVGQKLVSHPKIKAVGFTGSIKGGRALFDLAAKREEPIPVFAEMGSINPVVIFPSVLEDENSNWTTQLANSINLGAGQFCTNPGLIFGIEGSDLDHFTTRLGEELAALDSGSMLHPSIHSSFKNGVHEVLNEKEVSTIAENKEGLKPNYAAQKLVTVAGSEFLSNKKLHKEVFGPFSMVVKCKDEEELLNIVNNLEGQLTGTVLCDSKEISKYASIIEALQNRVGRIIFNGVPTGVEVCPSMMHGGPYPASTDSRYTAVGTHAIARWVRPFTFQDWPNDALPKELQDGNPLDIVRLVDGNVTKQ